MNAQAEEQVGQRIDQDNEPGACVHEALERGCDAGVDQRHEVGRPDAVEQGGDEAKDSERDEHRDHGVEGVCDRRRNPLAQVHAELLVLGELDEHSGGDKANDDGAKQAVGAGVGLGEHVGDVVGANGRNLVALRDGKARLDLLARHGVGLCVLVGSALVGDLGEVLDGRRGAAHALGHHDAQGRDANDHAGNGVLEALVLGEAIADDARKNHSCHIERTLGNGIAPVLGVGERVSRKEQREDHVVDKNRDASQNVDGHDGRKGVAQAPQVNLVAYLCGYFRKAVEK